MWDVGAGSVRSQWSASSFHPSDLYTGASGSPSLLAGVGGGGGAAEASVVPMEGGSRTDTIGGDASGDAGACAPTPATAPTDPLLEVGAGATRLLVASRAPVAVVASRAGLLSVWDLRLAGGPGSRPVRLLDGHAAQVLDMCWLPYALFAFDSRVFVL